MNAAMQGSGQAIRQSRHPDGGGELRIETMLAASGGRSHFVSKTNRRTNRQTLNVDNVERENLPTQDAWMPNALTR